jgi:hypothetical protein
MWALVLSLLPGISIAALTGVKAPFWDVVGGRYETPVTALWQIGVVSGKNESSFAPEAPVTRAEMAALLIRALRLTDDASGTYAQKFEDVSPSHWAFGVIMTAESRGIIRGVSPTQFRPNDPVTYAEATVMTLRALARDNGKMEYPTGYVIAGKELGLLDGLQFDLFGKMTRGEVAALLANAVFKIDHLMYGMTLSQALFGYAVEVAIRPDGDVLMTGANQLEAVARDAYGKDLPESKPLWQVTQGSASITAQGSLTVQQGPVTVSATVSGQTVSRTYAVVSALAVRPDSGAGKPGEALQLSVVDPGNPGITVRNARWAVVSGPAQVSDDGRLTFTGAGSVTVKATAGNLTASATYAVLAGLTVEPQHVIVTPGDTVQFSVKGTDGSAVTGPVQWSVEGSGVINSDGKFTAVDGSAPTVTAKMGSLTGSAKADVVHRLMVAPAQVSVSKAKTVQFTATGVTTDGTTVSVPVTWSNTRGIGVVGADGAFVATTSGTGQVTANYGKLQASVSVSVSGDPYALGLSASRTSVPANGRSQITLTLTLKDANGIRVTTDTTAQLMLSDSTLGTVNTSAVQLHDGVGTATFTPSTNSGTIRISAAAMDIPVQPGIVDISSYVPVPAKIRLEANPNPVAAAAGSQTTISGVLVDNEGQEILNGTGNLITVQLYYSNTTAATLSNTIITVSPNQSRGGVILVAANPGDTVLTGSSSFLVEPVTVHTVLAGPAAKVVVRPGIQDTRADGYTDMPVYAEIQDANGVVRTQDNAAPVTLSIVSSDGTTLTPLQTVLANGVATFRVRNTVAGTYTFTGVVGGLKSVPAQGVFLPGQPSKLLLSGAPVNTIATDGVSKIRLQAKIVDAYGNLVPTAGGTVIFSRISSQNATALPVNLMVTAVNGVAELPLGATIYPGTDTFKATMVGLSDSNLLPIVSQITGVPSRLWVQPIGDVNAIVGGVVRIQVLMQDSRGQVVTNANGRVIHVVPNSPTAVVTGTGLSEAGSATFTISDTIAGSVTLNISADGISTSQYVTQFLPGSATKVVLKVSSAEMSADGGQSFVLLTAEAQDVFGNKVTNQPIGVAVSADRPDVVTVPVGSLYTENSIMLRSTQMVGTVRITGTASVPVTPVSLSTFTPGVPTKVVVDKSTTAAAGTSTTFQVRVVDNYGHTLTSVSTGAAGSTMGVTLNGTSGNTTLITNTNSYGLGGFLGNGTTNGTANVVSGVATFTYSNSKSEVVTVSPVFYWNGTRLPAESGTITTTAGRTSQIVVTAARTGLSNSSSESTTVIAKLVDNLGNTVPTGDADTFTFTLSGTTYLSAQSPVVVTSSDGTASLNVASKVSTIGGQTFITVTSAKTGLSSQMMLVTDAPPSSPIVWVTDDGGRDSVLGAGDVAMRIVISLDARITDQTVVVYVNGFQVNLYAAAGGGALNNTIAGGQTSLVGYVTRTDLGGPGQKIVRVLIQNAVGASPLSPAQVFTVQ